MPLDLILTMQVQFGHAGPIWALWVMFWTILGPPGVPKRPQSGPIWHIMMYYTCENYFNATWANFDHAGSIKVMQDQLTLWVMFWTILGPPGVPKGPQNCPKWLVIMFYTRGKYFRAIWGLPGWFWALTALSSSEPIGTTMVGPNGHTEKFQY